MDLLQAMKVFVRVAETGSFSRAADSLNLPKTSATVIMQQLEAHLKVRLMQRTTRRVSLTAHGSIYYDHCVRILLDVDEAAHALSIDRDGPRGRLRIDVSGALGRIVILPKLHDFTQRYPDIELMLSFGDKPADLVAEGIDCAIRIGVLSDSSLVARRLGDNQLLTVASASYLEKHGTPVTLAQLHDHTTVNYFWGRNARPRDLNFLIDGQRVEVALSGTISVNDAQAYFDSALAGHGIVQTPRFLAQPHLIAGNLVEIMPQWKPAAMPIAAVYPHGKHLSPAMRAFIDWLVALFESDQPMWRAA